MGYIKVRDLKEALDGVDDELYVAAEYPEGQYDLLQSVHQAGVEKVSSGVLGRGFCPSGADYTMFVLR